MTWYQNAFWVCFALMTVAVWGGVAFASLADWGFIKRVKPGGRDPDGEPLDTSRIFRFERMFDYIPLEDTGRPSRLFGAFLSTILIGASFYVVAVIVFVLAWVFLAFIFAVLNGVF